MSARALTDSFSRLPSAYEGRWPRWVWLVAAVSFAAGAVAWALGFGIFALWCFAVTAAAVALVLPLPYALVSPLFMGVVGWFVNMLPFIILIGWGTVAARWAFGLLRERRLPRGGRWRWLPVFLAGWTLLGFLNVPSSSVKHWILLVAIQGVSSAVILAVVDCLGEHEERTRLASGLIAFVVLLSVGVFLQWVGVPLEAMQDEKVANRVEAAYGVDAFPNNIGMIKYARSIEPGVDELDERLGAVRKDNPDLPRFTVFQPRFQAFESQLVARFDGSARAFEGELSPLDVSLLFDNVGIAPASEVPRLRSFPRNALTYAGVCAALFPIALYLAWAGTGRRRLLGRVGAAAALFGAGFSLARGAWVAVLLGVVYLIVDGVLSRRSKLQVVAAYLVGALVLTGVFLIKYNVDPLNGRAGGAASVNTRGQLYEDTVETVSGLTIIFGYGTERPRTESGTTHQGAKYVPQAGTHSTYLNYLFRTGLPGAVGIMALYVLAGLHTRAAARAYDDERALFNTMLTASMVIISAHGVILSLFVEPVYTLVVSLVVGIAMAGAMSLPRSVWPWRKAPATA